MAPAPNWSAITLQRTSPSTRLNAVAAAIQKASCIQRFFMSRTIAAARLYNVHSPWQQRQAHRDGARAAHVAPACPLAKGKRGGAAAVEGKRLHRTGPLHPIRQFLQRHDRLISTLRDTC